MRRLGRNLLLLSVLLLSDSSLSESPSSKVSIQPKQVDLSESADQKRDEVITELKSIMPRVDQERQLELKFRLAETYWEKSRFAYNKEYMRYDNAFQAWVDGGRKGPEPDLSKFTELTEKYRGQALTQYQAILDSKVKYDRTDEVLFMLAYNQIESGRKEEGRQNLKRLVERFPQSRFAPDAQLAIGEDAFKSNDLNKAEAAFKNAFALGKKSERSSVYVYALYKLAWCDYNRHDFNGALAKFKEVVKLSEEAKTRLAEGSPAKKDAVQLQKEALADLVKAFAQVGNVDDALKYFGQNASGEQVAALTLRLARAFNEQGDSAKEVETYERLISQNPQDEALPNYLANMLAAQTTLNRHQDVLATAKKIVDICKNSADKDCEVAESKLREITTTFHKFAQNDRYQKDYLLARSLYEIYLSSFRSAADYNRLAFYYADLLWDLGELTLAAKAYQDVVAIDHKGENALTASMNAVMAYEKVSRNEPTPQFVNGRLSQVKNEKKATAVNVASKPANHTSVLESQPLSSVDTLLVQACDQYVALVEELGKTKALEEDVMNTSYKAAYIYQTHFMFDEANKRFDQIIQRWPKSKMAHDAVLLVLDGDDARKDWSKLLTHAKGFAENSALMQDKVLAATVQKFIEGAAFNSIASKEASADAQQKQTLAHEYESFAAQFPTSSFAASALFNSLLIYRDSNQTNETIRIGQKLLEENRLSTSGAAKHDEGVVATTLLAMSKAWESNFEFAKAAKLYEQFAMQFKAKAESADMLYNAGVLQMRAGHDGQALSIFDKHLKTYKDSKDTPQILLLVASIHEAKKDRQKAKASYERYLVLSNTDPLKQLSIRFKLAQSDSKQCTQVLQTFSKLSDELKKNSDARKARAYCGFMQLEAQRKAFDKISMKVSPAKLRAQINAKKSAMEQLASAHLKILDFGDDEWGIAALYQAVQAQIDYVNALREIPDPKGLDPEALGIFRQELENIVAPVETDAVQALEKALARAYELKVYTSYTKKLRQTLTQFYPPSLTPFTWEFERVSTMNLSSENRFSQTALSALWSGNETLSRWAAEQSIAANQDQGTMFEILAQWEMRQNQLGKAAALFAKSCEATSPGVNACANLGSLALEFGDFKQAATAFAKAKEADPKNVQWKMALGYALAASGDTEKAIAELSALFPENGAAAKKEAYACMCMIYRNQKSDAKAALDWCNKYRIQSNGLVSDADPMKPIITSLEAEIKASNASPSPGDKK